MPEPTTRNSKREVRPIFYKNNTNKHCKQSGQTKVTHALVLFFFNIKMSIMKYSELTIHEKINYKNSLLNHTNFNKSKIFERILTDEIKILESKIGSSFGEIFKNQFKTKGFTFYEYKKQKK